MDDVDVEAWAGEFESLMVRVGPRFGRSEPRGRVRGYVAGLLSDARRKNAWNLAERAGQVCPDGMQRLLRLADFDADAVAADVRDYVIEHLRTDDAVLIVDETGFLKKGTASAGVQRQYCGTAGRVENCQVGVFAAYASARGHALVDRDLYLPQSWADDPDRCRAAGIFDTVEFATKPRIAQAMVDRALAADVPFRWFTADEAYGQVKYLRRHLEERDVFHVVATRNNGDVIGGDMRTAIARDLIAALPPQAWRRFSVGAGSHGPRLYDWARIPIRTGWRPGRGHWLLARRSTSDHNDIAYYICYGPRRSGLVDLAWIAGSRWRIEECFQ